MSQKTQAFFPREWKENKCWNPYNSFKLLVHTERWRHIRPGHPLPSPVLITVDPSNTCNLACVWCNAQAVRAQQKPMLSEGMLTRLAKYLPTWGHTGTYPPGVKAVCVAGGGEPLVNTATPVFIEACRSNDIEVGLVTNGTRIHECLKALTLCTWVGVSVDAGTSQTFAREKGLPLTSDAFERVLDNIARLTEEAKRGPCQLGKNHPSYGVSYKYLLTKDNIGEIATAAKLAKELGCKSIHIRPAGTPWNRLGTAEELSFSSDDIAQFHEELALAQELDDTSFSVYAVTHKFNTQFGIANCFARCYAIFMTAVVAPARSSDAFTLSLCCDRRGDKRLELLSDCPDIPAIEEAWGSARHWAIQKTIDIAHDCPRCTYQPHNQIYQEVIINDSMTDKFI